MTRQRNRFLVRRAFALAALMAATLVAMAGDRLDERAGNPSGDRLEQAGVSLPATGGSLERDAGPTVPSGDPEAVSPEGVDPGWWGKVQNQIAESEYEIAWQEQVAAYQSPNRAQNLRFTYRSDGFTAEPRTYEEDAPPWKLSMKLAAWGREDERKVFRAGELKAQRNQAEADGDGITVMYLNNHEGMRQDFLVRERPRGSGLLRLWLNVESSGVAAEVEGDGREVTFGRAIPGGARVLTYGDLEVRDASGRVLQAAMAREGEDLFAIVVDDADAVYPVLIDPLSSSPDWTAEGNQPGVEFGHSVATAGDVNGDGYSDVIVGAHWYDNGQSGEGLALVYQGSASGLSTSPAWTVEGNQAYAELGCSVATAGDINGDGYSDVIVGAQWYSSGQMYEGCAFVYHGSSSGLAASPAWTGESNSVSGFFGRSVAAAGDVNGDGYGDIIVGAPGIGSGGMSVGRAYVYLGTTSGLEATPDWTAEGDQTSAGFAHSVAAVGDVNGDGYGDVIIGAYWYDNGEPNEGRAYVYHGGPLGLAASPAWTAEGNQENAEFGYSVGTAGDTNGDGYSDVIVGAHLYDNGEVGEGRASVYHGSATGLATFPAWTAESDQSEARFGCSVGTAGDTNGDGYSDVIVGAHLYDNGEVGEGRAYVFLGSPTGLFFWCAWTAEGNQTGAFFGGSVATAGDVNGDGYSDIIVGADSYDNGQSNEGRAFVYHGGPAGLGASAAWYAESNQTGANFGASVATAGDVNGDGFSDVIVGAWAYDNGETDEGRAFVYHGSSTGLSYSPAWTAEGNQGSAYFGRSAAGAGDVNGDGYSDVIVGANRYNNGQTNEGRAYVYHGSSAGLGVSSAWTAESDQEDAWFGYSVATAGDVNGDGYSDVIVGAYLYDNGETNEGRTYVYHGGPAGLAASPDWTAESNQAYAWFGHSAAGAGDVNGDGYSDVIVGAYLYDNGETEEGRAFVYRGSSAGLSSSPDWTAESNQAGANFGISVATGGDVNGDGYSDVIVGAYHYDNGQTDEGWAFVYHGSSAGLSSSPDWTAESNQAYAYFGISMATAGDVNGDGYSDVIVGAYRYDNGHTNEGRAFVYHGGPTGLSTSPDWTAEGDQEDARFGFSVATAGDINGDGYSDVIVGAYGYDNGQTDEGRAFVYHGNMGYRMHVLPRQWRTDLVTPVVPALKTRSQSQAGLGLYGRTFFGRSDVRVQFEVKPLGTIFDGTGLVTTGWMDPGTTGAAASEVIGGLSDRTMYRWRARVGYRLSDGAPQPYGRWIYQPYNGGLGEADFYVGIDDLTIPELHIDRLSATQCRLWWYTVADASIYRVYRDTTAFFIPGAPWQMLAAPDTSLVFTTGVGDPATNYYFLCRSVGAWGESENSNRVGEIDLDTSGLTVRQEGGRSLDGTR